MMLPKNGENDAKLYLIDFSISEALSVTDIPDTNTEKYRGTIAFSSPK
jgi:hypothetical protein